MVAAALDGARTKILVLPTVALRVDMVVRLGKVGIKHLVIPGLAQVGAARPCLGRGRLHRRASLLYE